MAGGSGPSTIDAYIAGFPLETQAVLGELRSVIKAAAPEATESISYGMPTLELNGTYLIYFAGWQKHVALYPVTDGMAQTFGEALQPYRHGKGSLRFPLSRPLPIDLIRHIVEYRVKEIVG